MSRNGEIETLSDGKDYQIRLATIYILDQNDVHMLRGGTEGL